MLEQNVMNKTSLHGSIVVVAYRNAVAAEKGGSTDSYVCDSLWPLIDDVCCSKWRKRDRCLALCTK